MESYDEEHLLVFLHGGEDFGRQVIASGAFLRGGLALTRFAFRLGLDLLLSLLLARDPFRVIVLGQDFLEDARGRS